MGEPVHVEWISQERGIDAVTAANIENAQAMIADLLHRTTQEALHAPAAFEPRDAEQEVFEHLHPER